MCPTESATLLRYCSVSRLIPKRDNCSSMVRFHIVYGRVILTGVMFNHTAHIPLFLYPFLNTTSKTRPFEYLRLTSLGVIGALVKVRHPIQFSRSKTIGSGRTQLTLQSQSIAKRQLDRDSLPALDGDNPTLPADHGDRL